MKIKLRDLSEEQYKEWYDTKCGVTSCFDCPFHLVYCDVDKDLCWVNHKDTYSDKFLDQEVEFEVEVEPILTDKEREYLRAVVNPFRNRVVWIKKQDYYPDGQYIKIEIKKDVPVVFPLFEENKYYKNMELYKKYTLEELGL